MKENLLKKFLKFSYGSWVGLVIGLLTMMLITRVLSPEALGKASMYDLFIQVGMIFTIFGSDQAFVRFFYEEKSNKRGALLYSCLRVPLITTLVITSSILFFYKDITLFLFGSESILLAIFISIGIVTQLLFRFAQLVIRMEQKANIYSLLQIFQKLFNLSCIIVLFYLIGPTFEILIFTKIITFILLAIIAIYFGKNFWSLRNLKTKDTMYSQRDIMKFGSPFVLTIFISWLFEAFDKIALRQWSNFDELGLYSAAMSLVALVMILKSTFSTFWSPISYERFEEKPEDKDFFRYISVVVSFTMFLVAIFSIAAKDLIVILLGSEYRSAAAIMPFLVFMPIFHTISETTVIGVNFYKKVYWHIVIAGVACGTNIVGNWLLVPNYGAIGASIATAFSYIIFFALRTIISLKYYKIKYPLIEISLMTIVVSLFAYLSIITENFWINLIYGLISILLLIGLFFKDFSFIIKNRKILFK